MHIYITLQVVSMTNCVQTKNIKCLTAVVSETAAKHGVLKEEAKTVEITFENILSLFRECHDIYSRAKPMADAEIAHFSKYTTGDVKYYSCKSMTSL